MVSTNARTFMFANDKLEDISTILANGGLLLYPTDTIWGLGCDATNPVAVERIYRLKKRDRTKSMIILVDSIDMLQKYVRELHPRIDNLLHYHERPLTIIFEDARNLPTNLVAQDGSIGIRIVRDEFCRRMIRHFGKPVVSTSANLSGEPFPTNFGSISSAILERVDYVVKHRQYEKYGGEPSVIVKVDREGELTFLRT